MGAVPKIWGGGFGCAIGAAGGSARGFPPGGCGSSFEVDAGGLGLTCGVAPLGFLDGGAGGLVVEDNAAVCVDCGKELEALCYDPVLPPFYFLFYLTSFPVT